VVRAFSSPAAHTCYTPPQFQTRRVAPFLSNGRIQREADKGAGRATGATPAKVVLEADALGRSLALRMTIENVSKLDMAGAGSELIRRLETSSAPSPFAAYLQDVEVMAMLKAAPLAFRSGELSFVHKTVQEYLAASGLVASLHRAFDGTSPTDVEFLLDEQAKASTRTNEATKSIVTSEPAVGVAEVAANAARLLKSAKARPLERLLAGLSASPLSQLRLAREEDGSVIEEQVLDFLVDAVLADAGFATRLRVLRKLVGAVELHGGALEQVGRNLQTLLTARLAKRAHGTLLHEAAREGNVAVLYLALDACKDMAAESESNASKGVAGDAEMKVVDAPDDRGQTALYVAAVAGNEEAVMLLLKNGANAGARAHLVVELAMVKNKVGSQSSEHGARVRGLVAKGCVPQFEDNGRSSRFIDENLAVGAWMAGLTSAAVENGCWRFEVEVVEVPIEQEVQVNAAGHRDSYSCLRNCSRCPPELSVGWSADDAVVDAFIPPGVEGDLIAIATCNEDVYGKKMEAVRGVTLGRDTSSIGFESRGTIYCNVPFEISWVHSSSSFFDSISISGMAGMAPSALQKWSRGDKLGVAIDMTRHVAFFAINDGEWVEVPLPKEEKRFFPALSGRFSGGELRLSIGERGDNGWRKREPPPGTGPFRAIKDAATGNAPALAAAASGHITVARALLERDASVWADVEREHRWTLLHASARWNDKALMEEALKHAPGAESMRDAEGLFPVELAALHQQKNVLAALLKRDVVQDSFAPLKDLLTVFPKVLDLSERKPPLGPRNAELLSGLLLVRGEGCHELNLRGQNLRTSGSKALAKALRVNGTLTSVELGDNTLGDEGWGAIFAAICGNKDSKIMSMDVSDEYIGPAGGKLIAKALRTSVTGALTSINLRGNQLGDKGWGAIFAAICGNKDSKIMSLDASGENIGLAGGKLIAKALCTSVTGGLTSLDLSSNQLCGLDRYGHGTYTAEGITAIADDLRVNGVLTCLNLSSNQLCGLDYRGRGTYTAEGITAIADALRVNGALTSINLRGNQLGDKGWGAIVAAICGNKDSKIMSLDASGENIGLAGGKLIAKALCTSVTGGLTSIGLSENQLCGIWTDDDGDQQGTYTAEGITAFADAMRVNGALTSIDLRGNKLCGIWTDRCGSQQGTYTAESIIAIADALRVNGALTALDLSSNDVKDEGVSAVCKAIQSNKETKLASLNFRYNGIGPVGANAVAAMVAVTGALTVTNLLGNQLDAESAKMLAEVAKQKGISLCGIQRDQTTAHFSDQDLKPPDAILLASDLSQAVVTGGLTVTNLLRNQLDAESAKMLAEVAKQKGISLCGIQRDQTTAHFSDQDLKPPDAILLASDLSQAVVTGALTKIE
jgi:NLR family CARD domain-containing protein 3